MNASLTAIATRFRPISRPISVQDYLEIRQAVWDLGHKDDWNWSQTLRPPVDADSFAAECILVICASGFKAEAARVTERRVHEALAQGRTACDVFPTSGKGRAIDAIWARRDEYFAQFEECLARKYSAEQLLAWIAASLPYVGGKILRYHTAKNFAVDLVKPDRWLCRLSGVDEARSPTETFPASMELCAPLAAATGDRIATVDVVLWRACSRGVLVVKCAKDEIYFYPPTA